MNVLCLSFRTPPQIRPQAILIGKMLPEWQNQGIKPILVTYENNGKWDIDLPIYKIPVFRLGRIARLLPLWRDLQEIIYYFRIYNLIKDLVKRYQIDFVFSFSNPQSSNVIGAIMSFFLGVKFVSYFSDPWFDNPYQKNSVFGKIKIFLLERFVVNQSDRILFPSKQLKNLVLKKYNKKYLTRSFVVPHCFNPANFPSEKKYLSKFRFSYIGAFFEQRNPEIFFRSLRMAIDQEPSLANKFEIILVGAENVYAKFNREKIEGMLKIYGLYNNTEIIPQVDYIESLAYMKNSDCLLVIDADFDVSPFLPSKLIDYFGSKNPIIGITPSSSATAEFLAQANCRHFNYQQEIELKDYLIEIISGREKPNLNQQFIEQFSVENTTIKYKKVFLDLIEKKYE